METVSTCDDSTPAGVMECWCARIRGRVQNVGYGDACVQAAQAVGVTGWVRNRKDGSVEVQLQGSVDQLMAMRRWLSDGPPLAEVRSIA